MRSSSATKGRRGQRRRRGCSTIVFLQRRARPAFTFSRRFSGTFKLPNAFPENLLRALLRREKRNRRRRLAERGQGE